MSHGAYRFVTRPRGTEHGHPVLVFDRQERLHLPLTAFAREAVARVADGTAQTYLHAILPFFTYLEADEWQGRAGRRWDRPPGEVRQAVDDYLVQHLRCKVRPHRLGFQLVSITAGTRSSIRVFLSGLKLYYRVMQEQGRYPYGNPLVDSVSATAAEIEEELERAGEPPRMPDMSGVQEPRRKQRLTDSYFKLEGEEWVPQVVDDPTFPARVLTGGRRLKGWGLREECVTRILFESGGRVSEVTGLTLGDWAARGTLQEANACSKGSHGVRVKFLRFASDTAKLLGRYCDEERRQLDPDGYTLDDYLRLARGRQVDLHQIPLFLSARRTPLSAKSYREHYWNPACKAAGIDADVHQARHWYVTMAVRQIYETAKTEGEVNRRLRELMEYMKWKRGWETIAAYEHYFDAARHAEVQDGIHARMDAALQSLLQERRGRPRKQPAVSAAPPLQQGPVTMPDDPDFDFLRSIGGQGDDN